MKQNQLVSIVKRRAFVLAALLAVMIVSTGVTAAAPQFGIGQPFPQIVLPSLEDGRPVSLAQFRGKKIILHIFASW